MNILPIIQAATAMQLARTTADAIRRGARPAPPDRFEIVLLLLTIALLATEVVVLVCILP